MSPVTARKNRGIFLLCYYFARKNPSINSNPVATGKTNHSIHRKMWSHPLSRRNEHFIGGIVFQSKCFIYLYFFGFCPKDVRMFFVVNKREDLLPNALNQGRREKPS